MADRIDTVSARDKLKPRRPPYWHRLTKGGYVGFRKMTADSPGTWLARYRIEDDDKQAMQSMGSLDEYPSYERFDKAVDLARSWFAHLSKGGSTERITVSMACADYVKHIRREKGDKPANDAEARFRRWVDSSPIGKVELAKLTRDHVKQFRAMLMDAPVVVKGIERPRAKDSINRDLTGLRAALNRALTDGKVTTDFAWREALKPIKNAGRRRGLYLDPDQRRKLIDHADKEIAGFLRGMALLPLRPGALAALKVRAFDKRLRALRVGKDKAGHDRTIILPPATGDFLAEHADGKELDAPLLGRPDGKAWDKDAWKWPVKAAAAAAGLPEGTTAYTLRHSVITDLVTAGLDLLTVAKLSGTSVAMIDKHYGHLRGEVAAAALAKLVV